LRGHIYKASVFRKEIAFTRYDAIRCTVAGEFISGTKRLIQVLLMDGEAGGKRECIHASGWAHESMPRTIPGRTCVDAEPKPEHCFDPNFDLSLINNEDAWKCTESAKSTQSAGLQKFRKIGTCVRSEYVLNSKLKDVLAGKYERVRDKNQEHAFDGGKYAWKLDVNADLSRIKDAVTATALKDFSEADSSRIAELNNNIDEFFSMLPRLDIY